MKIGISEMCMRFNIALDDKVVTEAKFRSTVKARATARIPQTAHDFSDAGATHFIHALNFQDTTILTRTVNTLASSLLRQLSWAVRKDRPHDGLG